MPPSSENSPPHRVFLVEAEHDGLRLDLFLSARIPRLSRSKAARICRSAVWIEPHRTIKPSLHVRTGDRIYLRRKDDTLHQPSLLPTIAYQDDHLRVLHKPPGLLIHPTARHYSGTLSEMIKRGAIAGCPTDAAPVHRIDRETSGLLMVGAYPDAIATLRTLFADEARITKVYWAVVSDPERRWHVGETAHLNTPLGFKRGAQVRIAMGHGDLPSSTHVMVRGRQGDQVWIECRLETGRQHQIRVHLAMEGTPLIGDKLYAMGESFFMAWSDRPGDPDLTAQLPHARHMLHAARLAWSCPWTQEPRLVEAPWPDDFPKFEP
ncbi:MAG: RluA family pseudouridine synthase [Myxococcota bacterium]